MSAVDHQTVTDDDDGIRLDRWFKKHHPDFSHGHLQKLMRKGQVRIDGKRVKTAARVEAGQTIRIPPLGVVPNAAARGAKRAPVISDADARLVREMVIHSDQHVFVLNKPPGLPVQGGSGQTRHLDGMLDALSKDGVRPKLVHRLDKDTSGCLVLARTDKAARALTALFRGRDVKKTYWALVKGVPEMRQGRIDMAIEKAPGPSGEKMIPTEGGKRAITDFAVMETAAKTAAWIALRPVTGRTHQLRVHMAEIGTPVIGDGKYGGREAYLTGRISKKLHLHARTILLPHPMGGVLNVTAPLPPHMADSCEFMGFDPKFSEDLFEDAPD